ILPVSVILIGTAIGIGAFTFVYARGYSYVTDDPAACANCHVMSEQYASWMKSSHRSVAVCNDCHTPHEFLGKYATKARNGFWHSYYCTLAGFSEPIQATARSREIAEAACRDCHGAMVSFLLHADAVPDFDGRTDDGTARAIACTRCHMNVG